MTNISPLFDDPAFVADLSNVDGMTGGEVSRKWDIAKSAVNKYRRRLAAGVPLPSGAAGTVAAAAIADDIRSNSDDTIISATRMADKAWGAAEWREFIRSHGQDPDTVTFQYGVTSNPVGGYWNKLLNVRPNGVAGQRLVISDEEFEAAQKRVRSWKLPTRLPALSGEPAAVVVNLADMQAWKPEGGGIDATLKRLEDGLENVQAYIARQRATGRNINEVVLVNNGDPFEGIAGNYANQTHTVKAGLRKQMNTVLDIWQMYAKTLFPQFELAQFVTMHCNHTQFGRQGGAKDSITGDEDTGSAFLAESLRRILEGRPEFEHVQFTIPDDEMNVYADVAGVPVGFNHGHKIPGVDAAGFEKWLNGQVRGDRKAWEARVWITAHKHHFATWDMGSCTVFQCPSCDGGSKWLRDTTGRFSRSGILALLVGNHDPMGWSDPVFL